jgi:hypothetical protein
LHPLGREAVREAYTSGRCPAITSAEDYHYYERWAEENERNADNYRRNTAAEPCPVQTRSNGGLPSGGSFTAFTEYEIGASRIAEAAHCILGSWGEYWSGDTLVADFEPNHVIEEFHLITKFASEYGGEHGWGNYHRSHS